MPKVAAVYDPTNQKSWRALDDVGNNERKDRNEDIDVLWAYYLGRHRPPLKVEAGAPDHNVTFNFTGQGVDKMAAFVGVPRFEVVGGTAVEPDAAGLLQMEKSPEQLALEQFWEANRLPHLVTDVYLSGFVTGHSFMRLLPAAAGSMPGVALLDAKYVTVYWDITDTRRVLFYRLKWEMGDEARCQDIVPDWLLAGEPAREPLSWSIIEYRVKTTWEEIGRDVWAYPFAPIVDWKNAPLPHEYYGRTDLQNVRLNDAANFVASNMSKIIYHHAGPQTIITGGKLDDATPVGPGRAIAFQQADAKVYNLEMSSDLASSMAFLDVLRGGYFQQARVVDTATIKDKLGQLTNFAVRMLYTDQLDAAYQKQSLYGNALAEVSRRAMAMMGIAVQNVNAVWDDPLPQSRTELVSSVVQEASLGITSTQTLLHELGRDPIVESEQKADEQTDAQRSVAEMLAGFNQRGQSLLGTGANR